MINVFISYDREDSDFAELVQARLHGAGHTIFMDMEILDAGDDWRDKIDCALRACQVLIVIMTPEAAASHYVAYEWAFALGAGVKVIPLELRTAELHPRLAVLQRISFTDKARPWQKLLEEVQKVPDLALKDTIRVAETAPPAVKKAAAALDSLDPDEQKKAVLSLAQMNHPSAQDALIAALQHPAKNVRITAAFEAALAFVKDPKILPVLFEAIRENWYAEHIRHYTERLSFESIAANIGRAAVPILIGALDDDNSDLRYFATQALGNIGDSASIPDLIRVLSDPNAYVRKEAAEALGKVGDATSAVSLRTILGDQEESVRCAVAEALGELKDKSALPELLEHLRDDPRAGVRAAAARAMGQIGDSTAVPDLLNALKSKKGIIRSAAALALGQIGDVSAINELRRVLGEQDEEQNVHHAAAEALALLKDDVSIPAIADVVMRFRGGTPPDSVVHALGDMGEAAVPGLIDILMNSGSCAGEAAKALKSIGSKEALDAVKKWEFES